MYLKILKQNLAADGDLPSIHKAQLSISNTTKGCLIWWPIFLVLQSKRGRSRIQGHPQLQTKFETGIFEILPEEQVEGIEELG